MKARKSYEVIETEKMPFLAELCDSESLDMILLPPNPVKHELLLSDLWAD